MKIIRKIMAVTVAAVSLAVFGNTVSAADISSLDNTCKGYGQGREVNEKNRPVGAEMFNGECGCYGCYAMFDDNGKICLTFDQGYENGYTASILDTLKAKDAKAVFFLTGDYAKRNEALVRRMIDEGHVIGNHGMKHASLPKLSEEEAKSEIMSLHEYVRDKFGYEMKYFRPPCGEYSERSMAICNELGYKTMLWSFAYEDWDPKKQPDCEAALERITTAAHGGEICLLHSVSATNAEILPKVIDSFREQGFEIALPEMTKLS